MFDNIIILNEKPKQPLKTLDAEMTIEEFTEFLKEFTDRGAEIEWGFNANNPDTWADPSIEGSFINFVNSFGEATEMGQLTFHTIYPTFGTILAIPIFSEGSMKINFVTGVDDFWENEVCDDCFLTLFNCEDDHENKSEAVRKLIETYPIIQHDQSRDNEFSKQSCDCCGSKLHGRRHFLVCMKGE